MRRGGEFAEPRDEFVRRPRPSSIEFELEFEPKLEVGFELEFEPKLEIEFEFQLEQKLELDPEARFRLQL